MKPINQPSILVSVIIPTLNSSKTLDSTIKSLQNQTFPLELLEIIVIDNGSRDKIAEICHNYPKVKYFYYDKKKSPASARNYGASLSIGKYLAFIDSDVTLSNNWLQCLTDKLEKCNLISVATAPIKPEALRLPKTFLDKYRQALSKSQNSSKPRYSVNAGVYLNTASLLIRKDIFLKFYFCESLKRYEDTYLSYQLFHFGAIVYSTDECHSKVYYDKSIVNYLARSFKNGQNFNRLNNLKKGCKRGFTTQISNSYFSFSEFLFKVFEILNKIYFTLGFLLSKNVPLKKYKQYSPSEKAVFIISNRKAAFLTKNHNLYLHNNKVFIIDRINPSLYSFKAENIILNSKSIIIKESLDLN